MGIHEGFDKLLNRIAPSLPPLPSWKQEQPLEAGDHVILKRDTKSIPDYGGWPVELELGTHGIILDAGDSYSTVKILVSVSNTHLGETVEILMESLERVSDEGYI